MKVSEALCVLNCAYELLVCQMLQIKGKFLCFYHSWTTCPSSSVLLIETKQEIFKLIISRPTFTQSSSSCVMWRLFRHAACLRPIVSIHITKPKPRPQTEQDGKLQVLKGNQSRVLSLPPDPALFSIGVCQMYIFK